MGAHWFDPPEPGALDWQGADRGLVSESDEPPESLERGGRVGTCCALRSDVDVGAAVTVLVPPGPVMPNRVTRTSDATMQARRLPAGNAMAA